jgi:lipoprotein-anchoring transpeptidase ErfK/SrfK
MGRLMNSLTARVVASVVAVALVASGVGLVAWTNSTAGHAAIVYQAKRHALDASLARAGQQGYTRADLAPITSQESALDRAQEPWWLPGRPGYYEGLTNQVGRLQGQLSTLEAQILDETRADIGKKSDAARASIAQAQQANAPDPDVQSLQQRLDTVARAQGAAHTLKDYRAADEQVKSVAQDASTLVTQSQQENQQVQQAAQQLVAQPGSSLASIQQAGQGAVAAANNDASVIAYLAKEGPFKDADAVARMTNRLGKYAPMIGSSDVNQAAMGAAAAQRYGGQIHAALVAGLPAKAVIVSFQNQHLWALEHGQTVIETPVTTGIRGVTDIGTDFGPMKVLRKSHPWTMQSPWPKSSPYWYPDTVVQWTTFFTNTGESIHDASWEPDSLLGPGSQYNLSTRSHGCIHVPFGLAEWMFNWADLGMPVIVYPGDGSPVANQLSLITTDDQGNPKSAPH